MKTLNVVKFTIYPCSKNRFLYTLYIAIDGNFKLKGKQRYLKDVELMLGWGAYVPEQEYQSHIASHVDEVEVRICDGKRSSPEISA